MYDNVSSSRKTVTRRRINKMANKPENTNNSTEDETVTKKAFHKTNNLAALAVGLAGASILFSAGTAFAVQPQHEMSEKHSSQSQIQGEEKMGHSEGQGGQEREQEREMKHSGETSTTENHEGPADGQNKPHGGPMQMKQAQPETAESN